MKALVKLWNRIALISLEVATIALVSPGALADFGRWGKPHVSPELDESFLELSGTISKADADAVDRHYRRVMAQGKPLPSMFALNSPGGDLNAAMRIGRVLRAHLQRVSVMPNATCASACVFVLAGGAVRSVTESARVGLHRPYPDDTSRRSLQEATKLHKSITALVRAYFEEMNLPPSLVEAMIRVRPGDIEWLSADQMYSYGLVGKGGKPAIDPAVEEVVTGFGARKYGLSRQEFMARNRRAETECQSYSSFDGSYEKCREAILRSP